MSGDATSEHLSTSLLTVRDGIPARSTVRVPITPLLGRDREVADVKALLDADETRLLTLTGPGGIGKTRLALEVASGVQHDFAHGACFVPLATIRNPDLVPYATAEALGIRESGDLPIAEILAEVLREQHILLLLDNLEHVVDAALWLTRMLVACPRVKVLVTSRVLLHVQIERHFAVPPLPVPPDDHRHSAEDLSEYPSVELFVERARAVQPDFAISQGNAEAVRDICKRLEGLPLAVELAAARINVLTPGELLTRLTDRLALLTGGMRDLPSRLQTMRNAIAWSYELLSPDEQARFRRLAIFVEGFTLEAAETISMATGEAGAACGVAPGDPSGPSTSVLELITSLVDQSLIRPLLSEQEEPQFGMFETIREYGLDQLEASGEIDQIARRHALYFLAFAEEAAPQLTGREQAAWLNRLESVYGDLRAAFTWFHHNREHDLALRLATALWRFGYTRGYLSEARSWLDTALGSHPEPSDLRAAALNAAGVLASVQGDIGTASAHHGEALTIFRERDDRRGMAMALNGLGNAAEVQGDQDLAFERYEAAKGLFREVGDRRGVAVMLTNLGTLHADARDLDKATAAHKEALLLFKEVGDPRGVAWSATNLGTLVAQQGNLLDATVHHRDAVALYRELGDQLGIIETLERFADIAEARGQRDRQVTLAAAAAAIRKAINRPVSSGERERYEAKISALRARLGKSFDSAWAAGQAMTLDEAIAVAVSDEPLPAKKLPMATPVSLESGIQTLSPREAEVLKLMAEGLTNQEIADRLYVSIRTVTSHTSNILGKLGLGSRTAVVAYAIRHNLV